MINHYALHSVSEEEAKKTFEDLFQLELLYDFRLDSKSAFKVFKREKNLHVLIFGVDDQKIEVFIDTEADSGTFPHLAFDIIDKGSLIERSRALGFEDFLLDRGEGRSVLFIRDGSGNLFEIK